MTGGVQSRNPKTQTISHSHLRRNFCTQQYSNTRMPLHCPCRLPGPERGLENLHERSRQEWSMRGGRSEPSSLFALGRRSHGRRGRHMNGLQMFAVSLGHSFVRDTYQKEMHFRWLMDRHRLVSDQEQLLMLSLDDCVRHSS